MTSKYPFIKTRLIFTVTILLAGCDLSDGSNGESDADSDYELAYDLEDATENEIEDVSPEEVVDSSPAAPLDGQDDCTGDLAAKTFKFALCTCRNATTGGYLITGSIDSDITLFNLTQLSTKNQGAAIGVNYDLAVSGLINIGGTTILAGPNGVQMPGGSTFNGDLKVSSNVNAGGILKVARDLVVGRDFIIYGQGSIGRDIYLGRNIVSPARALLLKVPNGQIIKGPVDVPPPCACGEDEIMDITGMVEQARNDNQNQENAIDENSLQARVGLKNLSLPSGRFYFSSIAGSGVLTLKIDGHTAVYVDGDVLLSGDLRIEMSDNATLDVFVAGDLHVVGRNRFGNIKKPSAVRFYVAGNKNLTLSGKTAFVGNLYAPNATVLLNGETTIYGSIFTGNFIASGGTRIYYDMSINRGGDDCDDGDGDDTPADDTCVPYKGECASDEDCCEPLVCDDGKCLPLLADVF